MIIHSVKFEDKQTGWVLEKTEFSPEITLLVGISGVGKTRILECLQKLHHIAKGEVLRKYYGLSWEINYSHKNNDYIWSGQIEQMTDEDISYSLMFPGYMDRREDLLSPKFLHERLFVNDCLIASREQENFRLNDVETPKLSEHDSILHVLKNEENVKDASNAMLSLLSVDNLDTENKNASVLNWFNLRHDQLCQLHRDIESIRLADVPTSIKLAVVYENCPEVFDEIKCQFIEAFPFVEGIRYNLVQGIHGTLPLLMFREHGVEKEIHLRDMSAGMRRTLMHISRLHLWPRDSVVLIDEFENSFGVNCIDFVADLFVDPTNSMQFIMTSHHPYVINTIPVSYWKVVVRDGCRVKTIPASEVLSSTSKHDAFIQLINLPQYIQGIATE